MLIKRYNLRCDSCGGLLDTQDDYDTKTQCLTAAKNNYWTPLHHTQQFFQPLENLRKSKQHFCSLSCLREYKNNNREYKNNNPLHTGKTPRRPFKEWDIVQYHGAPFIVSRDEDKSGYVTLEGHEKAHYTALTLLLPAEKAKKETAHEK